MAKPGDVTAWTSFVAEDPSAVDIDEDAATAEVRRGGRHIVVARYLSAVIPIVLVSPLNNQAVNLSSGTLNNFVDDYVTAFTRRASLAALTTSR